MTQTEALKMALEALEVAKQHIWLGDKAGVEANIKANQTIIFIKEALAQPERDYERGFIDGMQKQMQSSVDKAVNRMAQPEQEPVGKLQEPTAERAWFTIAELNAWADKKLAENPHWVMPNEEPERKEALAQEQDNAYIYASNLAKTIWQKHDIKESPKFALLDTTQGVLTQIDNMTCGLVREKPAQPEQEPVGRYAKFTDGIWREVTDGSAGVPLYTAPPQRTEQNFCPRCGKRNKDIHTCTPPQEGT